MEKEWNQRGRAAWRWGLEEAQLLGARDRSATPADAQLAIDLAIVPLDGVDREVEFLGDLAVREAGGDEAQDLHLAVVEGLDQVPGLHPKAFYFYMIWFPSCQGLSQILFQLQAEN